MTTQTNTPTTNTPEQVAGMTLIEHLVELRIRMVRASYGVLLGLVIGVILIYPGGPVELVDIIIRTFAPINESYAPTQSVGTAEEFTSYMTVALTIGIIVGMPGIVYQLFAFIVPGLTRRERRLIFIILPFVTLFFLSGLAFGWFITVPTAIRFLIGFSSSELIQAQPTLSNFLSTITMLLVINGVVFQLPVVIVALAFLGIVDAAQLRKFRRFAVVIVVIVAALITPTGDPVNLALLAIPMYLLYEVGVFLARFVPKRT